jgi:hypothetical protein
MFLLSLVLQAVLLLLLFLLLCFVPVVSAVDRVSVVDAVFMYWLLSVDVSSSTAVSNFF